MAGQLVQVKTLSCYEKTLLRVCKFPFFFRKNFWWDINLRDD